MLAAKGPPAKPQYTGISQGGLRGACGHAIDCGVPSAVAIRRLPAPDRVDSLLAWYDRHARVLPWRARPGEPNDPYRVWLSEIMLQQTTVKAVGPYFLKFMSRWPAVADLAAATQDDVLRLWAGLGYYSRARNLHACAVAVMRDHGGRFPDTVEGLRTLPGIGPYTAAAIAAIAFDRAVMPIDGNIERVVSRLFALEEELPKAKPRLTELAATLVSPTRAGDAAQALMDLGATICTPKKPACALCPLNDGCVARERGDADSFPRKAVKTTGALRLGAAYVLIRGGKEILLRNRPEKGLLGGMAEVPTTEWSAGFDHTTAEPPQIAVARWRRLPGIVSHVFTHFPLELTVHVARIDKGRAPAGHRFVPIAGLAEEALPNVMRKVIAHALAVPPTSR